MPRDTMKKHRVILEPGSYRDNENGRREETFALSFDTYVIAVIIKNVPGCKASHFFLELCYRGKNSTGGSIT